MFLESYLPDFLGTLETGNALKELLNKKAFEKLTT